MYPTDLDDQSSASPVLNRRQLVQCAGSVLLIAGLPAARAMSDSSPTRASPVFLIDRRFSQAAAFSGECARRGLQVISMQGDVTTVWMTDLELRWRKQPGVLAGVTGAATLACLEILANRERMRVVFRSESRSCAQGLVEHRVHAAPALLHEAHRSLSGSDWVDGLVSMMSGCSPDPMTGQLTVRGPASLAQERADEPLIAWVIAPLSGGGAR